MSDHFAEHLISLDIDSYVIQHLDISTMLILRYVNRTLRDFIDDTKIGRELKQLKRYGFERISDERVCGRLQHLLLGCYRNGYIAILNNRYEHRKTICCNLSIYSSREKKARIDDYRVCSDKAIEEAIKGCNIKSLRWLLDKNLFKDQVFYSYTFQICLESSYCSAESLEIVLPFFKEIKYESDDIRNVMVMEKIDVLDFLHRNDLVLVDLSTVYVKYNVCSIKILEWLIHRGYSLDVKYLLRSCCHGKYEIPAVLECLKKHQLLSSEILDKTMRDIFFRSYDEYPFTWFKKHNIQFQLTEQCIEIYIKSESYRNDGLIKRLMDDGFLTAEFLDIVIRGMMAEISLCFRILRWFKNRGYPVLTDEIFSRINCKDRVTFDWFLNSGFRPKSMETLQRFDKSWIEESGLDEMFINE